MIVICPNYPRQKGKLFIPGKEYIATDVDEGSFSIGNSYCLFKGCAHINHKDWIIKSEVETVLKDEIYEIY